jgi:uncharacterized protein (DUF486 family)
MIDFTQSRWLPVLLLACSNIFMTVAWYAHLRHKDQPIWKVIVVSWGIAFFEYLIMVPANRWGSNVYSTPQLKIIQEAVTLIVFAVFAVTYLGEPLRWNHFAAFLCIMAAVCFIFFPHK